MKKLFMVILTLFLFFNLKSFAQNFVEGEVLVKVKRNIPEVSSITTTSFIRNLDIDYQSIKIKKIFSQGSKNIFLIKSKKYSTEELIKKLKKSPDIEYVEPNFIIKPLIFPNDLEYADNDYTKYWGLDIINAFQTWDIITGSNDVVIAVLDTGIDYTHPDLKDNIWRNEAECNGNDSLDDDGNGYLNDCMGYDMHDQDNDPIDYDGHGTHVAGIIGAVGNNELGIAGVNWNVKLLPCKIFDDDGGGYNVLSAAIECLNYIIDLKKKGVNIVASNNSWAASPGVYLGDILKDVIQESINAGILFITAAGNEGSNNDEECKTDEYCQHVYPCDYKLDNDGIICVTATDVNDELPFYSNYGLVSVDIAAPGDSIYSTLTTQERVLKLSLGNYGYESGTSMAAPFVTGAIGLIKSKYSFLTWRDVKATILQNADIIPALKDKVLTSGRLNLYAAILNPVKAINEDFGIIISDNEKVNILDVEGTYYTEDEKYVFVEEPKNFIVELLDNDSVASLKFKFLSFDYAIEPAVCFDNDHICHRLDHNFYTISVSSTNPYVNVYIEDNSLFDTDNEIGKVSVNLAFVKLKNIDDNESNTSSSGGGCSLSKQNDYSIILIISIFILIIFSRRKLNLS